MVFVKIPRSSPWGWGLLLIAALLLINPSYSTSSNIKPKPKNSVPTYEEYVELSISNNWTPSDPIQKFEATVRKYSQLLDVVNSRDKKELEGYASMMGQEVMYLLTILSKATHHKIDLSQVLHASLDVVQEITYRSLKLGLSAGETRMITRSEITNNLNHWMYTPLRELVKLSAARLSHIQIDHNARNISLDSSSGLMKVTKYRLYGLISVFLELGADASSITEAMRIALLQGDDLALSLLLGGLTRVYPHVQMDVRRGLDDLIALAEKMHSTQLTARLRSVLVKREPGDVQLPVFNDYAPFAWQMLSYANTTCDTETASGGYQPALLAQTYSAVDETVTAGGPGVAVPVCAVDSVDIRSLSAAQFHRDYVLLNRPVVLTGGDFAASLAGAVWGLDALLSVHGAVRDVSSAIPYATLFGHTEEVMSLRDFVHQEETGMRAYSEKLAEYFASSCAPVREEDLVEAVKALGLPRYIFSGMQQNMNKAMRKHMLEAVLQFGDSSLFVESDGSTAIAGGIGEEEEGEEGVAEGRGKLLRFMQSVSASSSPSASPVDFKPHWKSQFYLGPALSGAPFHHHGPAFNLVVHGRKEWTLLPPGRDIYSSAHPVEWLAAGGAAASYYPYRAETPTTSASERTNASREGEHSDARTLGTDRACKLVQRAGEVLFVPRHWTHQVLNLAESIGFAVEIDDYKV